MIFQLQNRDIVLIFFILAWLGNAYEDRDIHSFNLDRWYQIFITTRTRTWISSLFTIKKPH